MSDTIQMSEMDLDRPIEAATQALLATQRADGHFLFELEADATIPAEYVLLRHYLGEPVNAALEAKIAAYLRRIQGAHGGWPLFHEGDFDMSASVKAYFALKMIGDDTQASHMQRARESIHARGGAAKSNVFTRVMLALFGILEWRSVPAMPIVIMLLLVLRTIEPKARNPKRIGINELFLEPPHTVGPPAKAPHQKWFWFLLFRGIDALLRLIEPVFPAAIRNRAI